MKHAPWTPAELAVLHALYPTVRAAAIAEKLGTRTDKQVLGKAWREGLKKSPEVIAQLSREAMANPNHAGRAHHFAKGFVPRNKGMTGWQAEGSQATQFKPGNINHSTLPLGSYRITSYGLLQQKISNTSGNNSKRWRSVHELVWIAANGPVPAGMLVVFKRGMATTELADITLDKIDCITRRENMRRNSFHTNYPKEVGLLIQLRGALIRKINHRQKKAEHENTPAN